MSKIGTKSKTKTKQVPADPDINKLAALKKGVGICKIMSQHKPDSC